MTNMVTSALAGAKFMSFSGTDSNTLANSALREKYSLAFASDSLRIEVWHQIMFLRYRGTINCCARFSKSTL